MKELVTCSMLLYSLVFLVACSSNEEGQEPEVSNESINVQSEELEETDHLSVQDSIVSMVNHPVFEGFGQLLLPRDDRDIDDTMQLAEMANLMPYHSHVNAENSVEAVNHLIDQANQEETIFYDIYTDDEKQEIPAKANTGLFYYSGETNAPFAVIAAGGGFSYVGSLHEGFPYAMELNNQGYPAFVLKYRVGSERDATEDLAAAISFIYKNAEELGVDRENYSLWGSSAGARMVANIGTEGVQAYGGDNIQKPASVITAYTGHRNYSDDDSPTFAVVSEDDLIASADTMEQRIRNLQNNGVAAGILTFQNVGHGFGLGIGTEAEGWLNRAIAFWEEHID